MILVVDEDSIDCEQGSVICWQFTERRRWSLFVKVANFCLLSCRVCEVLVLQPFTYFKGEVGELAGGNLRLG
jgi:hypothetical protein